MTLTEEIDHLLNKLQNTISFIKAKMKNKASINDLEYFSSVEEKEETIRVIDLIYKFQVWRKQGRDAAALVPRVLTILNEIREGNLDFIDLATRLIHNNPFESSEDMNDFIFEKDAEKVSNAFFKSFWETCASMVVNGVDLTDKQMNIVNREYLKVKDARKDNFLKEFTKKKAGGIEGPGIVVGFTGTRKGMDVSQKNQVEAFLSRSRVVQAHHGDAIGADANFHEICVKLGIPIVIHPPVKQEGRANCIPFVRTLPEKPFIERDREIVDTVEVLLATPRSNKEELRSGTWASIRYAKKKGKILHIFYPVPK